jgi:hypothetical protein
VTAGGGLGAIVARQARAAHTPAVYGIIGGMEKTTVYLTSEQKAALARAAREEGRSEARLIRAGIDTIVARHRSAETRKALADPSRPAGEGPVPAEEGAAPAAGSEALERPRWVARDAFVRLLSGARADPGLRDDLRAMAPGTTDDEPLP